MVVVLLLVPVEVILGLTISGILSAHLPKSAHPWAPTDVQSAHGLYNSTLLVDKSAHKMQKPTLEVMGLNSKVLLNVGILRAQNDVGSCQ